MKIPGWTLKLACVSENQHLPSGHFHISYTSSNLTFFFLQRLKREPHSWTLKHRGGLLFPLSIPLNVLISSLTLRSSFSAHYPASLGKVERRRHSTLSCYTSGQKWKCSGHEIHLRLFSAHFPCLESLVWEMSCGMIFKLHTRQSVSLCRSRQLALLGFDHISAFLAGLSTTQTAGGECLSSINFSFHQTKSLPVFYGA